jgi:hypothetical protein
MEEELEELGELKELEELEELGELEGLKELRELGEMGSWGSWGNWRDLGSFVCRPSSSFQGGWDFFPVSGRRSRRRTGKGIRQPGPTGSDGFRRGGACRRSAFDPAAKTV